MKNKKQETVIKGGQADQLKRLARQAYIAIGVGIVLVIGFAIFNMVLSRMQTAQLNAALALEQFRLGSKTLTHEVQSYAVTGEQKYYDAYFKELNDDKNREEALIILQKCRLTKSEWASFDQISELSNSLFPVEEAAIAAVQSKDRQTAQSYVFSNEYEDTVTQIEEVTGSVIEQIRSRKDSQQTIFKVLQVILEILLIFSILYIVFQIVKLLKFAFHELLHPVEVVSTQMIALAQGDFSIPLELEENNSEIGRMVSAILTMKQNQQAIIREISDILGQMGNGNYNITIEQAYVGEFAQIKESFLSISAKMKETLQTIREVSMQIDSGSEQLAFAAEDLAEGSTNQAGQVSDLVVVFKEMTGSMEQNTVAAEESVQLATQAGVTLTQGNIKMEELKGAISEISKCSEQIGTIISTIEDIASQTNLLSLNAAIEAAKAGEAGKGFAVVAEQVKSLADESAKAAGRTTKLIETAIAAIDSGIIIADETAANMGDVMESAQLATQKMSEISKLLQRDTDKMHLVNDNLMKVSAVVDNNSATSQETAAVSEEQKAQVETMVQLMDQFSI